MADAALPEGAKAIAGMKALAARDLIRAYILYLDGQAISYLYQPVSDGVIIYAYLGCDPDHAQLSVGMVLHMEALQRLFGELIGSLNAFDGGVSLVKGLVERHGALRSLRPMVRG